MKRAKSGIFHHNIINHLIQFPTAIRKVGIDHMKKLILRGHPTGQASGSAASMNNHVIENDILPRKRRPHSRGIGVSNDDVLVSLGTDPLLINDIYRGGATQVGMKGIAKLNLSSRLYTCVSARCECDDTGTGIDCADMHPIPESRIWRFAVALQIKPR